LILVPQAVMGIAAVLLTYDLVRRRFGAGRAVVPQEILRAPSDAWATLRM
jgi:hypothetical protein